MFAPPSMGPIPINHFSSPQDNYGQSPVQQYQAGLKRSNSLDWKAEAGLPPPPSEIDRYPDIQRHMQPSPMYAPQSDRILSSDALPTHAVTKHPKLKLKILLANGTFQAGDMISGVLEITSSTSQRLRLGEIAVELEAFEELSSRDHAATQIFLYNRTLFQGEHLPPSNAVLPAAPIQGHWTARKGRTTFPFSFHIPASAPSSVSFAGNANLRYCIKGTAQTWWNEAKALVTVRSDAFVVERWHDELDPKYMMPVEAIADTHIFMGGSGAIWLEASIAEQLFVAGNLLMIRAGVKNNSKRHLSGIKVCIARRLIFPASGLPGQPAQRPSLEPQISEVIHSQQFKGPSFEFPPNEEVVVNLAVDLPKDLRTIRKTRLFEVETVAIVSAHMGNFAKDLSVEIPMFVAHPNSVQHRSANRPIEPLHNLPQRARSAMSQHGQHRTQPSPMPILMHPSSPMQELPHAFQPENFNMAQYEAFAAHRGWSPAPPVQNAPIQRSASAAPYFRSAEGDYDNRQHAQRQVVVQQYQVAPQLGAQQGQRSSAILPPMPTPQQIPRSQSAAPDVSRIPTQVMNNAGRGQAEARQAAVPNRPPVDVPDLPARRFSGSSIPLDTGKAASAEEDSWRQSELAIPHVPSPSQLLGPDGKPVGLATIEEDSESAVGTVRSMRTLIGSVSRGDIDQFEAMVRAAEDEVEARHAMQAVGMVPEEVIMRAVARETPSSNLDKSLPIGPNAGNDVSKKESASKNARPRASDIFARSTSNVEEAQSQSKDQQPSVSMAQTKDSPTSPSHALPARPASAQGLGLTALESRLRTSSQTKVVHLPQRARKSEPTPTKPAIVGIQKQSMQKEDNVSKAELVDATTLSAAEQEQRQRRKDVARLMKETEKESKAARSSVSSATERMKREDPSPIKAARETVNVDEMRKLTKEAVGRVNGWLSTSPSSSRTSADPLDAIDPALSPKTPSPSVLRQDSDVQVDRVASRMRMDNDGDVQLSAELRALVDGTETLSKPKKGTSISEHPSSRRFSAGGEGYAQRATSVTRLPLTEISNEEVSVPKEFEKVLKRASKLEQGSTSTLGSTINEENKPKYDVRSARGGRGGRVTSVASMWTSIAEGTDGGQAKSTAPVLTLKPKAIRSGSQIKLDFGKENNAALQDQQKKDKKASAALLIVDNKVKATASKGTGAPQFVNTTMPRPIFATPASPDRALGGQKGGNVNADLPPPTRQLATSAAQSEAKEGKLRNSRKITSDLVAAEARLRAGRDLVQDADPALPMNGRGTTKPIGQERLSNLRSLWGG